MTTTINASPTNGIVQTADGSGVMKLQSNGVTTNALAWARFDSSSGSSVTVNASYNVSSITYNGTGDFTLNFSNALSDTNYGISGSGSFRDGTSNYSIGLIGPSRLSTGAYTTSACRVYVTVAGGAALYNLPMNFVTVFGN